MRSKTSQTLTKLIVDDDTVSTNERNRQKCDELPETILAELLGEAYNSRYMSVNRPTTEDEVRSDYPNDQNLYTLSKRKVENLPSFYVEEKHAIELSAKPAWDIRGHIEDFESQLSKKRRRKRAISVVNDHLKLEPENAPAMETKQSNDTTANDDDSLQIRSKRAYGRSGAMYSGSQYKSDYTKSSNPWKCDASIKWVDLGPDYFPRFLRSVQCTRHKCWYSFFECKPKSFAVKVLHRRKGMCADASNLRKISSFEFHGEFGEVWKWKEVAVNFCCDCAVA